MKHLETVCDGLATLSAKWDEDIRLLSVYLQPKGVPCVSWDLIHDLETTAGRLQCLIDPAGPRIDIALRSSTPGVFSLGGDLALFVDCIKSKDLYRLHTYARLCTRMVMLWYDSLDRRPIRTWAFVDGAALGGGLEIALACDHILVKQGARIGFPEYHFGSFPGMGAVPMLQARRIDPMELYPEGPATMQDLALIGASGIYTESMEQAFARIKRSATIPRSRPLIKAGRFLDTTTEWLDTMENLRPEDLKHIEKVSKIQQRKFK